MYSLGYVAWCDKDTDLQAEGREFKLAWLLRGIHENGTELQFSKLFSVVNQLVTPK